MKISSVHLQNVKSYADALIPFAEGTNAICGPNGAGKSTVLEAIGFVLFDYLQTSQSNFVRTGEKTAIATVNVEKDGREYAITRSCGGTSRYAVFASDAQLTDGKAETVAWIHEFLNIPENEELSAIFRDAVGVPQGLLTAAFLETPANRKRIFGPLLHVDAYERAWSKLRDAERIFEGKVAASDVRAAGLEAEVAPLDSTEAELDALLATSSSTEAELEEAKKAIGGSVSALSKLDYQAGQIEGALDGIHRESAHVSLAQERATVAGDKEKSAREAANIVSETSAAYHAYEGAQRELEETKDALGLATTSAVLATAIQGTLKDLSDRSAELGKQVRDADGALERVGELAATVEVLTTHKDSLDRLLEKQRECSAKRADMDRIEPLLNTARTALTNAGEFSAELFGLREIYEDRQKTIDALEPTQVSLKDHGLSMKAEIEMLQLRVEALSTGDSPVCPVCDSELSSRHRNDLLDASEKRIAKLLEDKESVSSAWASGAASLRSLREQVTTNDRRIAVLEAMPDQEHFQAQVSELEAEFNALQQEIDSYADIDQDVRNTQYVIKSLGDPTSELAVCKAQAESKHKLLESLEAICGQVAEGEAKLRSLSASAKLAESLKIEANTIKERVAELRAAYELYIANQAEAATYEDVKIAYETAESELQRHQDSHAYANQALDELRLAYDEEVHAAIKEELSQLTAQKAVLEERQSTQEQQACDLKRVLTNLRLKRGKLGAEKSARGMLDRQIQDLHFLRESIREAGPEITKMLVASISITADRLFSDIVQDASASLEWTEDYDVVVTTDGQERHFNQLSGGEQMSAALSVRLALLRELSDIDFAFFDEPTVNLDAQHRESLAIQIMNIQGFSQLFVISHDDSFEQGVNNAVRIVKRNGESAVI